MATIYHLPTELIARIITIGCEEHRRLGDTYYESRPRHLKPLPKTAALVCRSWHDLIYARWNRQFWRTNLSLEGVLDPGFKICMDMCDQVARFASLLSQSQRSDLYLYVSHCHGSFSVPDPSRVEERLIMHALSLLMPYSKQLRHVQITFPVAMMGIVRSWLNSLSLSRLLELSLSHNDEGSLGNVPLGDIADRFVFHCLTQSLDICHALNCVGLSLRRIGLDESIRIPPNIKYLGIHESYTPPKVRFRGPHWSDH